LPKNVGAVRPTCRQGPNLSDHRDASFSQAYGTLIKELRIDSRAIFVVDGSDTIRHVEYVKEVADHPNYEAALAAAKGALTAKA
jgi:thiol peroxidase